MRILDLTVVRQAVAKGGSERGRRREKEDEESSVGRGVEMANIWRGEGGGGWMMEGTEAATAAAAATNVTAATAAAATNAAAQEQASRDTVRADQKSN